MLDSSSIPSQSLVNQQEFSATLGKKSGKVVRGVNQTRTSIMRKNNSRDTKDVHRCTSCLSSLDHRSRSNSRSSLSASRRGAFPVPLPMPQSHSRECMACLKNFVAQKKAMIEVKAQQFLEEKPLPPTISTSSPAMGGLGRKTTLD